MGLFSTRNSTSTVNEVDNYFYDQRSVIDAGGGIVGTGNTVDRSSNFYMDDRDLMVSNTDASFKSISDDRDFYFSDSSNRSVVNLTNNTTGTDPGVLQLAELNAGFLDAAARGQSDTVRMLTQMGADTLRSTGGAATDIFRTGFQNSATAWEQTLDAGTALIDRMLLSAGETTRAAQGIATSAIGNFAPAENKQSDALKWIGIAAVGLVALLMLRK